ncbi:hypothetical protein DFH09DRAFT_623577 [Mycena vulgaris]|nr:hypothetical protein DFH09DRAFT_623577 [Mycena vulgaris]
MGAAARRSILGKNWEKSQAASTCASASACERPPPPPPTLNAHARATQRPHEMPTPAHQQHRPLPGFALALELPSSYQPSQPALHRDVPRRDSLHHTHAPLALTPPSASISGSSYSPRIDRRHVSASRTSEQQVAGRLSGSPGSRTASLPWHRFRMRLRLQRISTSARRRRPSPLPRPRTPALASAPAPAPAALPAA